MSDEKKWIQKQTRRSFLTGGITAAAGIGGWTWLSSRRTEQGIPWPLRQFMGVNEGIWREVFRPDRLSPNFPPVQPGTSPRKNGDLGMDSDFDPSKWMLKVSYSDPETEGLTLRPEELRWLPRSSSTTEFRCIEGWSEVISYAGYRFSDFLEHFKLGRDDEGNLYPYVGLTTPDGKYYVSIDMESMLHPQTVLVDEMNGAPLKIEHGAPLRLIIPIKYGIKSLKRIGTIHFSQTRPPDYWAERGYDWYAGF